MKEGQRFIYSANSTYVKCPEHRGQGMGTMGRDNIERKISGDKNMDALCRMLIHEGF